MLSIRHIHFYAPPSSLLLNNRFVGQSLQTQCRTQRRNGGTALCNVHRVAAPRRLPATRQFLGSDQDLSTQQSFQETTVRPRVFLESRLIMVIDRDSGKVV